MASKNEDGVWRSNAISMIINEKRWDKVLEKIKPGDYVIIQFGHNDEKPGEKRHTDPGSTFDYNLAKYVRETREKGGIPVLMNCVVRRNFSAKSQQSGDDESLRNTTFAEGSKQLEGDSLIDTHGLYAVAPKDVAKRMNVNFVDANKITHDLEQGLGMEKSKKLHMWFLPGEEPSVPDGRQDNTHYNIYGAHQVARLLADALVEEIPVLKSFRVNYDIAVDKNGRGDFIDLQKAVDSVPAQAKGKKSQPVSIQILGGTWDRPVVSKNKNIQFVMRQGATWK